MKKNNMRRTARLLISAYAFAAFVPFAAFAVGSTAIRISTAEELMEFSKNCSLDTWSRGKRVVLDSDIELGGTDFQPIPAFSGTFEGGGHTISGLTLSEGVSYQGLFRYIQQGGVVQDLNVKGKISADGEQAYLGGIAGSNEGKISGCSFSGTVSGKTQVGGIVGVNRVTGSVYHCKASGRVDGERSTGGVAGENEGVMTGCENLGAVNTLHEEKTKSIETLGDMNQEEALDTTTDTGGIVGYSTGSLQSCKNAGSIGYPHVGYNVGGVAGRSSGYTDSCVNTGTVLGRKDTGGIIGQMEPDVRLIFGADTADKLETELNRLYDTIGAAQDHTESKVDAVSDRLDKISALADTATDSVSKLADSMESWGSSTIDTVNDAADTVADTIDRLSVILKNGKPAADTFSNGLDGLEKALDVLAESAGLGQKGIDEISKAIDSIRELDIEARYDELDKALKELADALEDKSGDVSAASKHLGDAATKLSDGLKECAETVRDLVELFEGAAMDEDDYRLLLDYLDSFADGFIKASKAMDHIRDDVKEIVQNLPDWDKVQKAASELAKSLEEIFREDSSGGEPETPGTENTETNFVYSLEKNADDIGKMIGDVQTVFAELAASESPSADSGDNGETGEDAYDRFAGSVKALQNVLDGAGAVIDGTENGAGKLEDILNSMNPVAGEDGTIKELIQEVIRLRENLQKLKGLLPKLQELVDALAIKNPDELNAAMGNLYKHTGDFAAALGSCGLNLKKIVGILDENAITSGEWEDLRDYMELLYDRFSLTADAVDELGDGLKEISEVLDDWEQVRKSADEASDAFQKIVDGFDTVDNAAEELKAGLEAFSDTGGKLGEGIDLLSDAMDVFEKGSKSLGETFDDVQKLFSDLSKRQKIQLDKLGSDFHNAEDSLHQAVTSIGNQMDALSDEAGSVGDTLSAEIRNITNQLNTVTDLLYKSITDLREKDAGDVWDDVSEKLIESTTLGKAKNCVNEGRIEGDLNVGGIAGAMAIEYDLDPEDDIAKAGDNTLNFHYETRAVLQECANTGDVVSKKDAAGGVLGRMELGYLLGCENYGEVETTDGSYTGGIAGTAKSTIRESFSKCALSGGSYTGGIAGYADEVYGCVSLVDVEKSEGYAGSVAGDWDREEGVLKGNRFVEGGLAAVDGISYAGQAEPVPYEKLMQETGLPEAFRKLTVSYVADGKPVESVDYLYGDELSEEDVPEVPDKDGYYGVWEDAGEETVTVDHVLNAVYTPYVTTISGGGMRDEVHYVFLVEGKFDDTARLSAEAEVRTENKERWNIRLSGSDGEDAHTVHFAAPADWEATSLRIQTENGGESPGCEKEGSCYVFSARGTEFTIEAEKALSGKAAHIIRLSVLTAVVLVTFLIAMKRHKKEPALPMLGDRLLEAPKDEAVSGDGTPSEEASTEDRDAQTEDE